VLQHRPPLTTTNGYFAMANRADITPDLLRQLIEYNPVTGEMFWKRRTSKHFIDNNRLSRSARAKVFNARLAGIRINGSTHKGYISTTVLQINFKLHRIAWAIYYGEWPNGQIDHINHDRANNSIANLRVVSNAINQRNGGMRSDNSSGVCGVAWNPDRNKWRARITVDGAIKNLGCFTDINDAITARKNAESQFGFHPNHGLHSSGHPQLR
jgi:HNH endonuclease